MSPNQLDIVFSNPLFFILALAALVVCVLWVCLPFAVFGTKPLIREHIAATKALADRLDDTNRLLAAIAPAATRLDYESGAWKR